MAILILKGLAYPFRLDGPAHKGTMERADVKAADAVIAVTSHGDVQALKGEIHISYYDEVAGEL